MHLTRREGVLASLTLFAWMNLFAGGILVDTMPYRCIVSPEGVAALQGGETERQDTLKQCAAVAGRSNAWLAWPVVLLLFLPLNLAFICIAAGALGTFGSLANLGSEDTKPNVVDRSNPYISGMLRGFFVYLFMISGLLMLDDDPFSSPTPGQYIRLAGFVSLLSFVVNYQPAAFTSLIEWAHARVAAKARKEEVTTETIASSTSVVVEQTVETTKVTDRAPDLAKPSGAAAPAETYPGDVPAVGASKHNVWGGR